MKGELHTDLSREIARRLGWPDPDAIGRGAVIPDQVEIASVNGSTRFLGLNIAPLTHFAGYNLGRDRSLGHIELPDQDVTYIPGVWPEIPLGMEEQEPLFALLQVQGYTHAFDEMTWPAGWTYARWFADCYAKAAESHRDPAPSARYSRLGLLLGMRLHYVQDLCVPEHRRNELLASHSAFEEQQLKRWKTWDPVERETMIGEEINKAPAWDAYSICRGLCQGKTPRQSIWSCRRRKSVDQSIRDGVRCTAAVLKYTPMASW